MTITIVLVSIFAITALVAILNRISPLRLGSQKKFELCPICAGVSVTWIWILIGLYLLILDPETWTAIVTMLMGGSVVGISYQLEKKISAERSTLLFKTLFIPAGFAAVYYFVTATRPWYAAGALATSLIVALSFLFPRNNERPKTENGTVGALEKEMEKCC